MFPCVGSVRDAESKGRCGDIPCSYRGVSVCRAKMLTSLAGSVRDAEPKGRCGVIPWSYHGVSVRRAKMLTS